MHGDAMDAVADLCSRIGNIFRMQPMIDRFPRFSAVIGPERACGRDCHVYSLWALRIEENGMQTHAARARLPFRAGIVFSEAGHFFPRLAAVLRLTQLRVFHTGVHLLETM